MRPIQGGNQTKSVTVTNDSGVDSATLNSIPLSSLMTKAVAGDRIDRYAPVDPEGPIAHSREPWCQRLAADVQFFRSIGASVNTVLTTGSAFIATELAATLSQPFTL